MKTVTKEKVTYRTVYVAFDGKEFDDESECRSYELTLYDYKECPECHGKGVVAERCEYDNYHTGAPEVTTIYPTCTKCNGKGYLKRKVKWE